MSNLIELNNEFISEPFKILFYKALQSCEIQTLLERIDFLDNLVNGLEKVENRTTNQTSSNHWMRIASGFSTVATIGAYTMIPFPFNVILAGAATITGGTAFAESIRIDKKLNPISEEIELHTLALKSTEMINWACLWQYCHNTEPTKPDELFRALLFKASRGSVSGDKLIRFDSNPPFMAAIKTLASKQGRNYEHVAQFVKAIKEEFTTQLEVPQIQTVPQLPPAIGPVTQLTAIDVPATSMVANQPIAVTVPVNWEDRPAPKAEDLLAPIKLIVHRNNSFYVVGSKGAGKGMLTANLLRWKLDQYPNAIALVLDPKGDEKEAGYWNHPNIRRHAFKGMLLTAEDLAEEVTAFLEEARHLISQADIVNGKRLFIVFDEFLFLKTNLDKDLFNEVARLCSNCISTGDSAGIHTISITQSFNSGDSVGNDEILKNMTLVGVFREDEFARCKKIVSFGKVNRDSFTSAEFNSLSAKSPVGRVMTIGGEFFPTPELVNYSGFDRDKGVMVGSPAPVVDYEPPQFSPSIGDQLAEQVKFQAQSVAVMERPAPTQEPRQVQSIFQELAESYEGDPDLPLMNDFILWLEKKQGSCFTQRQIIQVWGNQKAPGATEKRGITSKEAISPYINEAIDLELINETESGYQVVSK